MRTKILIFIWIITSFVHAQMNRTLILQKGDTTVTIIVPIEDNFELQIIPSVSVDVQDTTRFIFKYTLINSQTSGQPIRLFEIANGPLKNEPTDTTIAPPDWEAPLRKTYWRADSRKTEGILAGDTLSGFIYRTWRLPDISYWYSEGRDTIYTPILRGPPYCSEFSWVRDTLLKIYHRKTPFGPGKYGRTLGSGPKPPMKSSWPWGHYPDSAFIHLRDRLSKCKEQAWVSEHAYDQIYRIIGHAWNHLENGRLEQSKATLTRLMKTLERFKDHGDIKDEAFYILYYRTKYVRDNLWYNP